MGDSTPLCPKPNMNNMNWSGISRKNFALQKWPFPGLQCSWTSFLFQTARLSPAWRWMDSVMDDGMGWDETSLQGRIIPPGQAVT